MVKRRTNYIFKQGLLLLALIVGFSVQNFGFFNQANAAAIIETPENELKLEENRSVIIRLDRKAANVFVANPRIADVQLKSPKLLYIFGGQAGVTTFYAVDANDNVIYSATVEVDFNIERIQTMMDELIPDATIRIQQMNGIIILTGFARTPEEADLAQQIIQQIYVSEREGGGTEGGGLRVINRIKVNTPTQVNLRVKIAEMSRDILKTLGFNWDVAVNTGGTFFGFAQGSDFVSRIFDENNNETTRSFLRSGDTNSAVFSNVGNKHDVNALVDALEDEGFLSILAEPNLTALSGETASFLAGGEFPVPVPQTGANTGAITIIFKQFGVGLSFSPTVLSENKIILKVAPEVSQLSSAGAVTVNEISIPALTTRRVNTTVELGSGQSFAIAGLLQSNITQEVSKFPILGDIPILGTLFRSDTFKREETELVIIVTPYIVRPVDPEQLVSPTDINHMSMDTGRWIKGKRDLAGDGGLKTGEGG